jgi:hypothetical protein
MFNPLMVCAVAAVALPVMRRVAFPSTPPMALEPPVPRVTALAGLILSLLLVV